MFKNTQQKTRTLVNYGTELTQWRKTRIKPRLVTLIAQQMCHTPGRHPTKLNWSRDSRSKLHGGLLNTSRI